jgi:hypothetical protein
MNILSTIHSKYQGETMFCFVCVATVFGYILGVNRVIDAIISKHSDETRVKVVRMLNKYTQTNFSEIAELLASNNLILSHSLFSNCVVDDVSSSSEQGDNNTNDNNNVSTNDVTNETIANLNSHDDNSDKQEKKTDQEKQVQENTVMSPSSVLTSEEDYELVRKNENVNHLKNKTNMKYFEWLNIF